MDFTEEPIQENETEFVIWPRYFLEIAYDGKNYHGWQLQPNGNTVQAEIELCLRRLLRQEKVVTVGCGRTDAGVHARKFFLHFIAHKEIEDLEDLYFRMSHMLPKDIALYRVFRVADMAHARFDATERSYEYHIHNKYNPFIRAYSTYCFFPLDIEKMNEAAKFLLGRKEFGSFCKTQGGQKTMFCDVRRAEWETTSTGIVFHITADRFLRNMVRAIVGTLVDVGRGRMSIQQFEDVIKSNTRQEAGSSMNAHGLFLTDIKYPYVND
jgi:tRNA pseudouridine38-40 synthase